MHIPEIKYICINKWLQNVPYFRERNINDSFVNYIYKKKLLLLE
jgi:hypothetical protein